MSWIWKGVKIWKKKKAILKSIVEGNKENKIAF